MPFISLATNVLLVLFGGLYRAQENAKEQAQERRFKDVEDENESLRTRQAEMNDELQRRHLHETELRGQLRLLEERQSQDRRERDMLIKLMGGRTQERNDSPPRGQRAAIVPRYDTSDPPKGGRNDR